MMTAEILAERVNAARKPRGAGFIAACPVCDAGKSVEFWNRESGGPQIAPRCGCPEPEVRRRWDVPAAAGIAMAASADAGLPDYGYVSSELLREAGCYLVDCVEGAQTVGKRPGGGRDYAGLVFPFFWPGDGRPREYRLRRNRPDLERKHDGTLREKGKYLSPPGRGNILYFHPATPGAWIAETEIPAVITEGEKKALALWRYFRERGEAVLVIGLTGVWNWRGVVGKETGDDGQRQNVRGVIPDLERILWSERETSILFDANVNTSNDVRAARACLTRELQQRGAVVRHLTLPADLPATINGVDDFLDERGPDALTALIEESRTRQGGETSVIELTDVGMLERLWQLYPGQFLYVDAWEKWGAWNGSHWDFVNGQAALQDATIMASRIAQRSESEHLDPETFERWTKRYRNVGGIEAVVRVARHDARFRRQPEEFDRAPWLINCANGTLDLRTGDLSAPDPADLLTRRINVAWDESAKCPKWSAFVEKIFLGKRPLIDYVQRALGYSLTGDTSQQCFFICHGEGSNGKGTIFRTMGHILGPYLKTAAMSTFMDRERAAAGHSDDLASLRGANMLLASEANEDMRLNEALLKTLTGEDIIRCSFKGKSNFEYLPTFKIWLAVNVLPNIRGLNHGTWRRVHRIPFQYQFSDAEKDPNYEREMQATELPGIFAWCVRGLWALLEDGFRIPDEITEAVAEYQSDMDLIGDFLKSCCDQDETYEEKAGALYRRYVGYCEENGDKPVSQRTFGFKLREKGFRKIHTRAGKSWAGLMLTPIQP